MTTVLNRDSIKVKRDFKNVLKIGLLNIVMHLKKILNSIQSIHIKEILITLLKFQKVINHIMKRQLQKIEDGTANLYKFDYQVGKKYIKVFNLTISRVLRLL